MPRPEAAEPSQDLFRLSSLPVISLYSSSPFPAVRPTRRELCIFVPSQVPEQAAPERQQGLGVLRQAAAGREWPLPAVPPPLTLP